ncbi:preprotein translocase subunit SecE [Helicobacter sp. MIT 14-3879]|uniref:preprotein translocase subunit SecE n=1 Tax=Helicobacter sp. MIT 14-3879 TaxID=2040649 RepID=UPI000E1F4606|nr:preprotein translocase subunit SecE [Helicobacter sp. MIT 14-3879]RDU63510.1 preprotein translocase subunit SecE [Helicobacter sp. MIT 14-3879]
MKKLVTFYRLAKDELDKVIFPIKEQIRSAHISVFAVVSIVTLFLALVNLILDAIVSSIL